MPLLLIDETNCVIEDKIWPYVSHGKNGIMGEMMDSNLTGVQSYHF